MKVLAKSSAPVPWGRVRGTGLQGQASWVQEPLWNDHLVPQRPGPFSFCPSSLSLPTLFLPSFFPFNFYSAFLLAFHLFPLPCPPSRGHCCVASLRPSQPAGAWTASDVLLCLSSRSPSKDREEAFRTVRTEGISRGTVLFQKVGFKV